jgi:hypothetical protein
MKSIFAFLAMLFAICTAASAQTGVFNVKILLPVLEVQVNPEIDKVLTHKLANDDIVNLALGRSLDTKVDKETEVLAAAVTFETEGEPPVSQLVVYDKTKTGKDGIVAVVGTMDMLEWQTAFLNKGRSGFGLARGKINATTLGTPAQNGFQESMVQGAGKCSGKFLFALKDDSDASPKGVVMIQGHVKYVYTDGQGLHTVDGFVTNGLGKISGKPIGGWEDEPL